MIEMAIALRALRRLALACSQSELDMARMEAADVLDQAGWTKSASTVVDSIGLSVVPDERERPSA